MPKRIAIDDTWYVRPANVRERLAAGGVVGRIESGQVLIGFAREGDFPAFVLPKGGVEKGEDLQAAAVREIEEEAGLSDLHHLQKLGVLERLNFQKSRWVVMHLYLYATHQVEGRPTDAKHCHGVTWFSLDDLPPMMWPDQRRLLEERRAEIEERIKAFFGNK